jgi:hypothetical protein
LVKLELQKLIRRKYLFVGAILLIVYTLFWFFVCAVNHDATFPTHTENGLLLEGRQAALYNKTLYEQYAGELTDEKVAEILGDFQTSRNRYEATHSDLYNAPKIYEDFSMFIATDENAFEKSLSQYGYVSVSSSDIPNFDTPLYFTFSSTWKTAADIFYNSSFGVAFLLLIALAPLFAEEYSSGAAGVILTTRYGKNKIIAAKCIVSLIVATVAVILFAAFVISLCGIYFGGFTGWQADIQTQFGSLLMPVPLRMNNLQFYIFSILMYWLSAIGVAALICCCSAFCKRSLSAFVASAVIYIVPYFIRQFGIGGTVVGELMLLFPVCSAKAQQVMRTSEHKMIDLLPVTCEMPIWIALFTGVSIFVLFFFAYRHFSKHQVMD